VACSGTTTGRRPDPSQSFVANGIAGGRDKYRQRTSHVLAAVLGIGSGAVLLPQCRFPLALLRPKPRLAGDSNRPSQTQLWAGRESSPYGIAATNPEKRKVQIHVQAPAASEGIPFRAIFDGDTFRSPFEWVTEGTTTFFLYDVTGGSKTLLASATATGKRAAAGNIAISFSSNPVSRSTDGSWYYSVTLRETNGVGINLTKMVVGGQDYSYQISNWFGSSYLAPYGELKVNIKSSGGTPPISLLWQFTGNDKNGNVGLVWSAIVRLLQ
jgi:hypothetical protein